MATASPKLGQRPGSQSLRLGSAIVLIKVVTAIPHAGPGQDGTHRAARRIPIPIVQ